MQIELNWKRVASRGVATLAIATFVPAIAMAGSSTGKGANPNGKPFVELAGEIVEVEGEVSSLQDQIDALVGRVDTVEQALAATQTAMADLQADNIDLQAQINANASDVASLEAQISDLNADILNLEAQIAANGDATGALAAQIADNEAAVTTLALAIDTLNGNLQASIDNNAALIAMMQQQIDSIQSAQAMQQQIISGNCPAGQSIRQVNADGSVVCEVDDVSGTAVVTQLRVYGQAFTNAGAAKINLICPAGSVLTGGGFRGNFGSSTSLGGWPRFLFGTDANLDTDPTREYIAEVVGAQYSGFLIANAICLEFN